MTKTNTYFSFKGNCREAMNFYKDCFGGELYFKTVGESPIADKMPETMKGCILHSSLTGPVILMGTDMVGEDGLHKGNAVSQLYNCESEEEIRKLYDKLSAGGKAVHPVAESFWGTLFGQLTDKYGNQWMLNYEGVKNN